MKNTGKEYETFVRDVQQILLNMEGKETIIVEQNKILTDRYGNKRQFDVYWEFKYGGYTYKNVIECKDYKSSISVEKIDAFSSKIADFPGIRGIFATTSKYQKGAKQKAEIQNISILTIREPKNDDWTLDDGTPLIREISCNVELDIPCKILEFRPTVKMKCYRNEFSFNALENEIFILENNNRISLYDIKLKLPTGLNEDIEQYIKLQDGKMEIKGELFHIEGYYLKYRSFSKIQDSFSINGKDYTKAYLEDHLEYSRILIKNDGSVVSLKV